MPDFNPIIETYPELLHPILQQYVERFTHRAPDMVATLDEEQARTLLHVWSGSHFAAELCCREPSVLKTLMDSDELTQVCTPNKYQEKCQAALRVTDNEASLMKALRQWRNREMLRIVWRDLTQQASLQQTVNELSAMADAAVMQTVDRLYEWYSKKYGVPLDSEQRAQQLLVVAMGKLGGKELNFSSDIDLIFAYPEKSCFFLSMAQQLIKVLHTRTEDGFVFRVDMRLRPYGNSGELAMSFSALQTYYREQGRDWERYALIKARILTGSAEQISQLQSIIRPFVYRRYTDYGVIESLRQMKKLIQTEVVTKGLQGDIKLGAGGIRQVEFIAQVFQLIRGGQDRHLQQRTLLAILDYLALVKTLDVAVVEELTQAYRFLRVLEHRLQMLNDQQTHKLPSEEVTQLRIARHMSFSDWDAFMQTLEVHRQHVEYHFERVLAPPMADQCPVADRTLKPFLDWWDTKTTQENIVPTLVDMGFKQAKNAAQILQDFRDSRRCRQLTDESKKRLRNLLPLLLQSIAPLENADIALPRLVRLIEAITRRSAYVVLLLEDPKALSRVAQFYAASPWIAKQVTDFPFLLDRLLGGDLVSTDIMKSFEHELRQHVLSIPEQDLEQHMEALHRFKYGKMLQIAAADILRTLTPLQVSYYLSAIAEVLLQQVQMLATRTNSFLQDVDFAIVVYGRLGGGELSYDSDLDLVFLYQGDANADEPTIRLAQRIIHIVNTRTASGFLYQVDTRLRPSGSAGLLVSRMDAFADYQLHSAWTWEHQALVRARMISGSEVLKERFIALRHKVLCQKRDLTLLRQEVIDMRERMREAHFKKNMAVMDVKQAPGGSVDIEFLVQYGVLAWAHDHPHIIQHTDNIGLLRQFAACSLVSKEESQLLREAYRAYSAFMQAQTLQETEELVSEKNFHYYQQQVMAIWQRWLVGETI